MKPPRLTEDQIANFDTLKRAAANGALALVSALDTAGNPVAILCAMQHNDDGTISPIPLAKQFAGNPYEELQDPTADPADTPTILEPLSTLDTSTTPARRRRRK